MGHRGIKMEIRNSERPKGYQKLVPRTKEQSLIEINQSKWIVLQITFSRLHSGSEGYQNGNSERGIKSSNLQYKKV